MPDFETAETHEVTVVVTDDNGGSDAITVTVEITDVDEPPAAPGEPALTATSDTTDSLTVTWTAPDNTGPPVTGYDVQYRQQGSEADFTAGPQNVTATSATLTGLTAATAYEVQVRASSDEGAGSWSSLGMGSTASPANATPEFVEGVSTERSVAENTAAGAAIGEPLTATDADADDTLTYALEGTDAASFAIDAASGQLRTLAALDFETDSVYTVTVRADDGRGGSGRIAVTINVTDQGAPSAPGAPTVTATSGTTDSLTVTWTAPDDTGPPVTGYDVQYRQQGSEADFTAGPQNVTATSATLTELTAAAYEVQVRARNAEGVSGWSPSGIGRTAAPAARGDDERAVTIAADSGSAVVGLDNVSFTLTRTGPTTDALTVTVGLSQTGGTFLTGTADQTVTFSAGSSTANLFLGKSGFSSTASGSGTLTATVKAGTGYVVGTSGSANVSLSAVSGTAMTVRLSAAAYSFDENAAASGRQVTVVAQMAPGLPAPGESIAVLLNSQASSGSNAATSGTDFTPLSERVRIAPSAFTLEGGRQVARVTQVLAITDDTVEEGNETLIVTLQRSIGTSTKVAFTQADGTACSNGVCQATVTIVDDERAVTIAADSGSAVVGLDNVSFTLTRTGRRRTP